MVTPRSRAVQFSPLWWFECVGGFIIGFLFSNSIISFLGNISGWMQSDVFPSLKQIITSASTESQVISVILIGALIIFTIKMIILGGHFVTYCIIGGLVSGIALPFLIGWEPIDISGWIMDHKPI